MFAKIKKTLIYALLIMFNMLCLLGCSDDEIASQHIGDPIAISGDVEYYSNLSSEEKNSLLLEKHIEVMGIVSSDGYSLFKVGTDRKDGMEISLFFDEDQDKLDEISEGDYIIAHGVCTSCFEKSMYLYGCKLTGHLNKKDAKDEATISSLIKEKSAVISSSVKEEKSNEKTLLKAPISSYDCEGRKYDEIGNLFEEAGFKINLLPSEQNEEETFFSDGDVIIVSAGEHIVFDEGEELPADVVINIGYCSLVLANKDSKQNESNVTSNITDMTAIMYVTNSANVRSGPSTNDSLIGSLSQGASVEITGFVDNGWYRVNYNGSDGYIYGDLLSKDKPVVKESIPVEKAESPHTSVESSSNNNAASSSSGNAASVTVPTQEETQGNLVWVPTNGGTKYHSRSSCSGMKDPIQVSLETAEANGYTPCKKCH